MTSPEQILRERLSVSADSQYVLYHYTTASGLLGILQTKALWATDIRYLNDSKEFEYAHDLVSRAFERIKSKFAEVHPELPGRLGIALEVALSTRSYVACFSEQGDSLAQWRAYARAGYAVGFVAESLEAKTKIQPLETILLRCEYDHRFQLEHIEDSMRFFLDACSRSRDDEAQIGELQTDFYSHVVLLCTYFKHPKFHEEQEWRMTIRHWHREENQSGRLLRAAGARIVPYRLLALARPDEQLSIRQLVTGPGGHIGLAAEAARIAVEENGVYCDDYRRSEIPYRDW